MAPNRRSYFIDSMRGFAVLLMVIYHFCYDLDHFRFVSIEFHHEIFWLHFRTFIITLFLLLVGISLMLAHHQGIRWNHALKRILILLACSAVIYHYRVLFFVSRPYDLVRYPAFHCRCQSISYSVCQTSHLQPDHRTSVGCSR